MANRSVTCMACTPPTEWKTEEEYKSHLLSGHGAKNIAEAMTIEKLKKQNLPNNAALPAGIKPEMLPDPEFIERVNKIENRPIPPMPAPIVQTDNTMIPTKTESVILEYKYKGVCETCLTPVKTIMIEAKGQLVASCYCVSCDKTLKQIDVHPILNRKENDGNSISSAHISRKKKV